MAEEIFTADGQPPVIARKELGRFTGGLVNPRTAANLDSLGKGPGGKVKLGRNVGYRTPELCDWLNKRLDQA